MPFSSRNPEYYAMLCLVLVAAACTADIVADLRQGVGVWHLFQEGLVLVAAIAGIGWLAGMLRSRSSEVRALRGELEQARQNPGSPPPEVKAARQSFATAMARQFDDWSLTRSEREVGMLLLKGFSLREISDLRGTAEKTIRQQASSVYKKAGLSGRHAFAAWFLEEIME